MCECTGDENVLSLRVWVSVSLQRLSLHPEESARNQPPPPEPPRRAQPLHMRRVCEPLAVSRAK